MTLWERFREKTFPRHVHRLQSIIGSAVPVTVDWESLDEAEGRDKGLDYDLEMLARGLEGDAFNPFLPEGQTRYGPEQICEGIREIRLRQVPPDEERVLVTSGVLEVDLCGAGCFSPSEVKALLLDRDGRKLAERVNAPPKGLSRALVSLHRYRLPAILDGLEAALAQPVSLELDWESLAVVPDAADRLLVLLGRMSSVLRELAKADPGLVVGGAGVHERAKRRVRERRDTVKAAVRRLRVRGGRWPEDVVSRLGDDALDLVVYQNEGCTCDSEDLERALRELLDLDVGPLLREVQEEHFPKAQEYLASLLNELIDVSSVRERVVIKDILAAGGPQLDVDWASLIACERTEDRLTSLRQVETGEYTYNRSYGPLFGDFFHALQEAARLDRSLVRRFIECVRTVRFEQVHDPREKELIARGSTLILRECLYSDGGRLSSSGEDFTSRLAATIAGMTPAGDASVEAGDMAEFRDELRRALGQVDLDVDHELARSWTSDEVRSRVAGPLRGALRTLGQDEATKKQLRRWLQGIRLVRAACAEDARCEIEDGVLVLACCPEKAEACPSADEIRGTLDRGLALRVRVDLERLEREDRPFWERMLSERFERAVPIEVDWAAFLAHPTAGGDKLYPFYVVDAGVRRLIYALTGAMDSDELFQARALERIGRLRVTSAFGEGDVGVSAEGSLIVYRAFADMSLKGFLSIGELEERLYRLVLRMGRAPG